MSAINNSPGSGKRVRPVVWAMMAALVLPALFLARREPAPPAPAAVPRVNVERSLLVLREGRLYHHERPFTGFMTESFANGTLQSRSAISNGLLHGISEGWHTNRVLEIQEHFVSGVSHGQRLRWNEQGHKISEAQIEQGKIEGIFRRWHENGKLAEELAMKHGEPEGLSRAWYPSGFLKATAMVSHGKVTDRHTYADAEGPQLAGGEPRDKLRKN